MWVYEYKPIYKYSEYLHNQTVQDIKQITHVNYIQYISYQHVVMDTYNS